MKSGEGNGFCRGGFAKSSEGNGSCRGGFAKSSGGNCSSIGGFGESRDGESGVVIPGLPRPLELVDAKRFIAGYKRA